jgi:hypothetical protein
MLLPSKWTRDCWRAKGGSSIGRVAVSKTVGWGFESLPPCHSEGMENGEGQTGGVAEWSIATVLKTVVRETAPGVRIPPPPPRRSEMNE